MGLDREMIDLKRFFSSYSIILSDIWLEGCVQWFRQEKGNLPYDTEELNTKVYEQWLLLDLRDVDVPVLPPNLAQQVKFVLNGTYSLQVLYIIDLAESKYKQLQKIRNANALVNLAESEQVSHESTHRVLQLTLTDGVQEIQAFEYKPISTLNINLSPGIKVLITGPVMVRRGQIFLEERNFKIHGGEVDTLLVSNAAENILARKLGLPENPNPNVIEQTFENANLEVINNRRHGNLNHVSNRNPYEPSSGNRVGVINTNSSNRQLSSVNKAAEEEELRIAAELLFANESKDKEHMEKQRRNCKSPDIFDDVDFSEDAFNFDFSDSNTSKRNTGLNVGLSVPSDDKTKVEEQSEQDIFENMDIDAHLDLIDKQVQENSKMQKIVKISELKSRLITNEIVKIHARFKFVLEKLTVTNDAWSLKLYIGDDTGELVVWMHSDVISELIGYEPSALAAVKNQIANKDEDITTKIMKAIEVFKTKIMELNCPMDLQYPETEALPTIIKLYL